MAGSFAHVLGVLRAAEPYPLDVRGVFKGLGGSAGDLSNSLRFFAWALQRLFELRASAPSEQAHAILSQVREVHSWIRHGASIRKDTSAQARARFEAKQEDLRNEGCCIEELFGDSPMGDMMKTSERTIGLQEEVSRAWIAYEPIARQFCAGCDALVHSEGDIEAFVDIRNLPLYEGEPFPRFVKQMADEIASRLVLSFSDAKGASLIIHPGRMEAKVRSKGSVIEIQGGLLEAIEDPGFEQLPVAAFDTLSVSVDGIEIPNTVLVIQERRKL